MWMLHTNVDGLRVLRDEHADLILQHSHGSLPEDPVSTGTSTRTG
jgi:hypothetical protein